MKYLIALMLLAGLLGHSMTANAALTDDMVGLYQFEDNFLDTSGSANANHGTPMNNPTFDSGKIGSAMSLTGFQDYMTLDPFLLRDLDFGNTALGTDVDLTMAMWVRQDDTLSNPAVLSNKDWDSGSNTGINWAVRGTEHFDLNTKGNGISPAGVRLDLDAAGESVPLTVGAWNYVVMSIDRDGSTELYINGTNTGTIAQSSQGSFNAQLPWNIGQDGTGRYSDEFTGAVDELAIWRRAISPSEASQLWNGGSGINLRDQVTEAVLKLVVDRDTGVVTIENNTGIAQDLSGYQITSAAGAFDSTNWTPITGRLDAAGDGSIDDDNWIVSSATNSASDLSELSLGLGTLAAGSSIDLGQSTWAGFHRGYSDIAFEYVNGTSSLTTGLVEFISDGDLVLAFDLGDLDFDGDLDSDDWVKLQAGFGDPLAGLSEAQRYRKSDLNNDSSHTLDDILDFRISYDSINGAGAFLAMTSAVPEPGTLGLLILAIGSVVFTPRCRRAACLVFLVAFVVVGSSLSLQAEELFSENFDGLALGPNVDESEPGTNVWTATPPTGWAIDNSGVPAGGVTEWRGWTFADPDWWSDVAGNQDRSQFTKGSGAIAVADPDEWNDISNDSGDYNTFLQTPNISLSGIAAGSVRLRFDSSWKSEEDQKANITVSFDGAPATELVLWSADSGNSNYKPNATNETVVLQIDNPGGASNMQINFGLFDAGNDWWWAIDNLEVFSPLVLEVDVQTGQMNVQGDSSVTINGYEINSPNGSLDPAGWLAGNLDAQNVGNSVPASSDFNESGLVDGTDLSIWESSLGTSAAGDADGDSDSDGGDFLRWQREFGSTGDPASTWLTFLATQNQLIESYLFDNSTFATDIAIGSGYDTLLDQRDLVFTYTTDTYETVAGIVKYVNLPSTAIAVPEPTSLYLFGLCGFAFVCQRYRRQ